MSHVVRHRSLSRRTFLRGSGAALALPWLDAMAPALRPTPPCPLRAAFVFAPNGKKMDDWTLAQPGALGELPPTLAPFTTLRDDVLPISGLELDPARSHGDETGDHARAAAAFLTCCHPRKTAGADVRAGISVDQVLAAAAGGDTALGSLELGMERGSTTGSCDSGYSCAYSSCVSWRSPTAPISKETRPEVVFTRLFGDPTALVDARAAARRRADRLSVLDATLADARDLRRRLGPGDRDRLDDWCAAVRDVERRLQRDSLSAQPVPEDVLDRLQDHGYLARLRLLYDLLALAFEADLVRVASFMLGDAGSDRSYRWLGVPEGHHSLSHHRGNPEWLAKIGRIDRFHSEELARWLTRLRATPLASGTLLDACVVLYGGGISDGNRHDHGHLPILVAGHGNGLVRPGRHVALAQPRPLADLYLALVQGAGVDAASFGDSRSPLTELRTE